MAPKASKPTDEEIAKGAEVDLQTVARAIKVVQSFTPAGLAARTPRECLLLQLERSHEKGSIAWDIVDKHLEKLERNRIEQIAEEVDAEIPEVYEAVERIKQLDPRPGRALDNNEAEHIIPECKVIKRNGYWDVVTNEVAFPEVYVNEEDENYQKDKSISSEYRAYLREMIERAKNLIQQPGSRPGRLRLPRSGGRRSCSTRCRPSPGSVPSCRI